MRKMRMGSVAAGAVALGLSAWVCGAAAARAGDQAPANHLGSVMVIDSNGTLSFAAEETTPAP